MVQQGNTAIQIQMALILCAHLKGGKRNDP
jgi:hypothetical protein